MIAKMSLQNFKSWDKTGDIRLAPLTGLFGTNSSGKTSILQLLLMLKQTAESADRTQVLNLGDERSLVELGTFKDILFNHVTGVALRFGLVWDLKEVLRISDPKRKGKVLFEDTSMGFQCEIEENGAGRIAVNRMVYKFASHSFIMKKDKAKKEYSLSVENPPGSAKFSFTRTIGRPWRFPAPVKCYGFPDQVKAYHQNAGFLSDFQLAFEELCSRIYYLGPLREYPKRQYTWAGAQPADMGRAGEKVVDAILASRERKVKISRGVSAE